MKLWTLEEKAGDIFYIRAELTNACTNYFCHRKRGGNRPEGKRERIDRYAKSFSFSLLRSLSCTIALH